MRRLRIEGSGAARAAGTGRIVGPALCIVALLAGYVLIADWHVLPQLIGDTVAAVLH